MCNIVTVIFVPQSVVWSARMTVRILLAAFITLIVAAQAQAHPMTEMTSLQRSWWPLVQGTHNPTGLLGEPSECGLLKI